jgi:tyrosine-specific transport protein
MKRGFFNKNITLVAATTLIGTIVGAGILGIPYVLAKAGFLYGFLLIVLMGTAFMFLNLFTGEVVLRTKKQHQLTGYAEKYLGKWGKSLMALSMFVATYGALTAYLIGEGATLHAIFKFGTPMLYTLIFFVITFVIIFHGVKATGKMELILISLLLLIIVLIGIFSPEKNFLNNFSTFNPAYFFLPYGIILFAFMGSPAIPELQEVLSKHKKLMKKSIIIGSLTPIILYVVFSLIIGSIVGVNQFDALQPNERIATIALQIYSQPILGILANLLAVLAMFTSFLTLGIALIEVYHYDYKLNYYLSLFLTFSLPLVVVFLNLTNFLAVLGVAGAFAGGLEGILIILMYWKAKLHGDRKPEYQMGKHTILGIVLIIMFAAGIFYQLLQNLS